MSLQSYIACVLFVCVRWVSCDILLFLPVFFFGRGPGALRVSVRVVGVGVWVCVCVGVWFVLWLYCIPTATLRSDGPCSGSADGGPVLGRVTATHTSLYANRGALNIQYCTHPHVHIIVSIGGCSIVYICIRYNSFDHTVPSQSTYDRSFRAHTCAEHCRCACAGSCTRERPVHPMQMKASAWSLWWWAKARQRQPRYTVALHPSWKSENMLVRSIGI